MISLRCVSLLLALSTPHVAVGRETENLTSNPIRRVVSMLQMMQQKITAEGEKEQALFDKFMCWCASGGGGLQTTITDAETKIPQLESSIKAADAQKVQLAADIKKHREDRDGAIAAMAEATAVREKEAAEFAKESTEDKSNIDAMTKAISALEKGITGAFLQTQEASVLRKITLSGDIHIGDADRDMLTSFLSHSNGDGYAPQSGEITGILKQMKDTMGASLAEAIAQEEKAKENYAALKGAKAKEVSVLQKALESKLARVGEVGVEIVNMIEDLDDTTKSLAEDKAFLADLEKNCAAKKQDRAERSKTRSDELVALADTIKILNDDDALEIFKKTLSSPSLLQARVSSNVVHQRALKVLQDERRRLKTPDFRLDLISLALRGRKTDFGKVIKMIDDMVALLAKEQATDDSKKSYCEAELDKADDDKKALTHAISDLDKSIEDNKSTLAALEAEIAALQQGIKDLDKQVAEASEQRKSEHADFVEGLAANNAANDLIEIAKNRMNKFYNPKLYRAPVKRELTDEERITVNLGGTAPPTAAPGGIAGTGVTALTQTARDAPAPPPETYGAYATKTEGANGVIAMMDLLSKDLTKEIQVMELEEKDAQADYENLVTDSAAKRAADSKSVADDLSAKADAEASLQKDGEESKAKMKEAMANDKYIHNLHLECDWLTENFSMRKDARAGEVDSLNKAKAVLSGADYSLVQTSGKRLRLRAPDALPAAALREGGPADSKMVEGPDCGQVKQIIGKWSKAARVGKAAGQAKAAIMNADAAAKEATAGAGRATEAAAAIEGSGQAESAKMAADEATKASTEASAASADAQTKLDSVKDAISSSDMAGAGVDSGALAEMNAAAQKAVEATAKAKWAAGEAMSRWKNARAAGFKAKTAKNAAPAPAE